MLEVVQQADSVSGDFSYLKFCALFYLCQHKQYKLLPLLFDRGGVLEGGVAIIICR